MAKLVDALCSGRSARKGVLVRIQFWAQKPYRLPVYKVFSFHQLSSLGKRMQPILSKRLSVAVFYHKFSVFYAGIRVFIALYVVRT